MLVLSMVAPLFGPRLLYRFLQDWVTQFTIGLFMGTFVYICLVFLVTHQDSPKSGYLQHVDHGALVAAAGGVDALIVLRFRPGQFLLRGEPLAAVVPAESAGALEAALDRGIKIGRHRTLTQDSEFGIAQVIEIAIRALSPAVNDTFTGVACVDWLADGLLTLAERPPLEENWFDTGGKLRVWMRPVRLERLVKLAFDQIRQASATTPAVLIRQLEAIRRLAPRLPDPCRQALSDQADAILETASGLVALDRQDIESAWRLARAAVESTPLPLPPP